MRTAWWSNLGRFASYSAWSWFMLPEFVLQAISEIVARAQPLAPCESSRTSARLAEASSCAEAAESQTQEVHEHLVQAAASLASLAQALAAAVTSPSDPGTADRASATAASIAEGVVRPHKHLCWDDCLSAGPIAFHCSRC